MEKPPSATPLNLKPIHEYFDCYTETRDLRPNISQSDHFEGYLPSIFPVNIKMPDAMWLKCRAILVCHQLPIPNQIKP